MRSRRRGNRIFGLGVGAIFVVLALAYWFLLLEPVPPSEPPEQSEGQKASRAVLSRTQGLVELRMGEGRWTPVSTGAALSPGSDLRTGKDGQASVAYGEAVRLQVHPQARVHVDRLDEQVTLFRLRQGLLVADVDPAAGASVQVATVGSDAVAETGGGRLHVMADGHGALRAAATKGTATLRAQGKTVTLKEGFQSEALPGRGPSSPAPLPASLFLKVRWPDDSATSKRRQLVRGTTTPGSFVWAAGRRIKAGANGRFEAVVKLREGENRVRIQVRDILGQTQEVTSPVIELDTSAPAHAVEVDPDMWSGKKR